MANKLFSRSGALLVGEPAGRIDMPAPPPGSPIAEPEGGDRSPELAAELDEGPARIFVGPPRRAPSAGPASEPPPLSTGISTRLGALARHAHASRVGRPDPRPATAAPVPHVEAPPDRRAPAPQLQELAPWDNPDDVDPRPRLVPVRRDYRLAEAGPPREDTDPPTPVIEPSPPARPPERRRPTPAAKPAPKRSSVAPALGLLGLVLVGGGALASSWPWLAARLRSEERRVGKECRSRWSPYH